MRPLPRPNLPLLATVLTWGYNFVALKLAYVQMEPAAVGLSRFLLMYAVLAGYCLLAGTSLSYRGRDAPRLLLVGFLSMGVYMVLFLEGIKLTTPTDAAIILASAPIFTYLLAAGVRQERFVWGSVGGAGVAFAGVGLVVLGSKSGSHGSVEGNLLILGSSVVWAASAVLSKRMVGELSAIQSLVLSLPGAALVLVPYGLSATLAVEWSALSTVTWLNLLYVALLAGTVGFLGFYAGIKAVGPSTALLYQYLVPPVAAFAAWIALGTPVSFAQGWGMAVVLIGVTWSAAARATPPEAEVLKSKTAR